MDFFKSVFSEDPPPSSSHSEDQDSETLENPNPKIPSVATAFAFGSTLFKSIATKSESVIGNYKRELEDFSSGLKKETSIVREAASRAVKDLPARLESGAAVAQTSLESVGQAIDNLGSTVSVIITHGKDSIFNSIDEGSDSEMIENNGNNTDDSNNTNLKPYSRIDALIRTIQCDLKTYCGEPEDPEEYGEWKKGFVLEEKSTEIEDLVKENGVIREIYEEVVPEQVDHEIFWSRYFFKIYRVRRAEEARAKLVKRAIEDEEEEDLSWDFDDDDEGNDIKSTDLMRKEVDKNEEKVANLGLGDGDGQEECDSGVKSDGVIKGKSNENESCSEQGGTILDEKVSSEGRNDNTSDLSVVSSQRSHEEEDLGWDEIEDVESGGDDGKAVPAPRMSPISTNLQKRSSAAEDDEDLTWDIEDDEEPIKS